MSISKSEGQKSIFWPIHTDTDLCFLTLIQIYGFLGLICAKNALFLKFRDKIDNLRQISHRNFTNNSFISLFLLSPQNKQSQSFKVEPWGFPKTISFKVSKFVTFLKITTCKQNHFQKYKYLSKIGTCKILFLSFVFLCVS